MTRTWLAASCAFLVVAAPMTIGSHSNTYKFSGKIQKPALASVSSLNACSPCAKLSSEANTSGECCGGSASGYAILVPLKEQNGFTTTYIEASVSCGCADDDSPAGCYSGYEANLKRYPIDPNGAFPPPVVMWASGPQVIYTYCGGSSGPWYPISAIENLYGENGWELTLITYYISCDGSWESRDFDDIYHSGIYVGPRDAGTSTIRPSKS